MSFVYNYNYTYCERNGKRAEQTLLPKCPIQVFYSVYVVHASARNYLSFVSFVSFVIITVLTVRETANEQIQMPNTGFYMFLLEII